LLVLQKLIILPYENARNFSDKPIPDLRLGGETQFGDSC